MKISERCAFDFWHCSGKNTRSSEAGWLNFPKVHCIIITAQNSLKLPWEQNALRKETKAKNAMYILGSEVQWSNSLKIEGHQIFRRKFWVRVRITSKRLG